MSYESMLQSFDESEFDRAIQEIQTAEGLLDLETVQDRYCGYFKTARAIICPALKFIKLIPIIGSKLEKALRFIISVLDRLCGVSDEC